MRRLTLLGSSHRSTPPSKIRELSVRADDVRAELSRLRAAGVVRGAVVLSTCNRFEVIVAPAPGAALDLHAVVGETSVPLHEKHDAGVVAYLLAVTAGLDSLVLGEEQILGQVRRAFQEAGQAGMLGRTLHMLGARLLAASREIRRAAQLATGQPSVASVAARKLLKAGPRLAVVGAGETGRQALEFLTRRGVERPLVVNRTLARAGALAAHVGGHAMSLDEFVAAPPQVDGILFAVHGPVLPLRPAALAGVAQIIDISQPSVLSNEVRACGAEVADLDDIAALAATLNREREHAAAVAAGTIPARAERLFGELTARRADIGRVVELHVECAMSELDDALRGALRHLPDEDRLRLRELMRRTAKRNAHYHISDLKQLQ